MKKVIIIVAVILIALCGGFYYLLDRQEQKAQEETKMLVDLQREAMQEELESLSDEYANQYNKLTVNGREAPKVMNGDSLLLEINRERTKVNNLLEELSRVKASSAREIAKLSGQVKTLRKVLRSYVVQIDSLHQKNKRLMAENRQVKQSLQRVTKETKLLQKEKEALKSTVELASKLDVVNSLVRLLDSRGRVTDKISRMKKIELNFLIAKNNTTNVGMKNFYIRIMTPKDEVMTNQYSGKFLFEESRVPYSIQRSIEYNGEDTSLVMYWDITESLEVGTYRVQVFEGGNMIGSTKFKI